MNTKKIIATITLLASVVWQSGAHACPFCSAVSQTLSQEMEGADVSVLARLVKLPPDVGDNPVEFDMDDLDSGMAEFEVLEVLRGKDKIEVGATIKAVYFGGDSEKKTFLLHGIAGERLDWNNPLPLTERGVEYIKLLGTLPEEGPERLKFFLAHLEDEDPLLAADAYDEFARAPYEVVVAIGDVMDRQQLIGWIEDDQIGPTRRRLYLTMLGICGQAEDVAILESLLQYDYAHLKPGIVTALAVMGDAGTVVGTPVVNEMIKADVRRKQQCLDALIAAYLKLKGPDGLPLIETQFLTNPATEYTQVYAAVMALRFHGEETDAIPKPRLLQSVRLLLDNVDIADQVIPDLARWEDWTVMDKLVGMFKSSDEESWVRQPVISYLLAATDQEGDVREQAETALTELEELDPAAVKRARSFMAFGMLARTGAQRPTTDQSTDEDSVDTASADTVVESDTSDDALEPESDEATVAEASHAIAEQETDAEPSETAAAITEESKEETAETTQIAASAKQTESTPQLLLGDSTPQPVPSRLLIIGGSLITGLFLFGIFALLLRGADVRSSGDNSQN